MVLEIGPNVVDAFQAAADREELKAFVQWWTVFADSLGPPPPPEMAKQVLENAFEKAAELGIEENQDNRVFLQAAATRLMPGMSGQQYLLSADAFFSDESDADRVVQLVILSQRND